MPAVLAVHTSGRIEPLAARLAEVLSDAPPDPLTPEWITVPSVGMRRWLSLELARHLGAGPHGGDGVVANVAFGFPGSLRRALLDDPARRGGGEEDPWRVEHLVWTVLAVVHDAGPGALSRLATVPEGSSLYSRARRIADLFDRYHVHRPDMVRSWAVGADVDGTGRPLAAHHLWQPVLWREVRRRIGSPSPPERIPGLLDDLHTGRLDPVGLPGRLTMFGLSLLPGGAGFLDLADAVATARDVHLFLIEPSPVAAEALAAGLAPTGGVARPRSEEPAAATVRHPLLRSWGRLHLETTVLVADGEREGIARREPLEDDPVEPTTLLGHLQADVQANREPAGTVEADSGDRSVEFHAAHGTTRQVEVLRDLLLHLLADPALELDEDDILVVSPDLERIAPVVEAVLGPSAGHGAPPATGPPRLRYRVADRSVRSANPVLEATDELLALVAGRFEAPAVLDLLSREPVRRRFDLDDDALARLREWVAATGVRWGLDADRRAERGVPADYDANTWRSALDRLVAGVAVGRDDALAVGSVAPHPVPFDDIDLLGRLSEAISVLAGLADATATSRPLAQWCELVGHAAERLFSAPRDEPWQLASLRSSLAELVEASSGEGGPCTVPLTFTDLRRIVGAQLGAVPGRPDFFRGGITVSSLTPLRWVPYRVVVAVGMDQHAFSAGAPDGDDLAAAVPLLGDRDRRGESRQALLEAVLSARDRLVVIREGRDVRTNHPVPPAVPVAELMDAVVAQVPPGSRQALRDRLEVQHPRHAHDERSLSPGELRAGTPWSFDPVALDGALARRRRRAERAPFLTEPLDRDDAVEVDLADLHAFCKEPVAHFLRRHLGVRLPRTEDAPRALLPVSLDPLENWQVGDRLLSTVLSGGAPEDWLAVERRRGTLPPGSNGRKVTDEAIEAVRRMRELAEGRGVTIGPVGHLQVDVTLPDGTRVVGTTEDRLRSPERGPARITYSKVSAARRLAVWLDLVALVATDPGRTVGSVGIYRGEKGKPPVLVDPVVAGATPEERGRAALDALSVVVDCYRRGAREPLPLFPTLSWALWTGAADDRTWRSGRDVPADGDRPECLLVHGDIGLDELLAEPARADDPVVDADGMGPSRAERYAAYLWSAVESSTHDRQDDSADPEGAA